MIRPLFPRPPGAVGVLPTLSRPPFPMIRGPIIPPAVRPTVVPIVTPAEKPQPTVYVGKIASTVENDFMLSLLQLCGPVKSWKRAQDPTNGTPRGFGFCEFESAEGVLCALRLLSKFNVDGQELVLNVNQATREYLERFVEKKTESLKKVKETEEEVDNKEESTAVVTKDEPAKPSVDDSKKDGDDDSSNKENNDNTAFGIVTEKDREGDQETLKKLINMIEERLKNKPLPPPPVLAGADSSGNLDLEIHKSKDGDMNVDIAKNDAADDKNDDDTASENKPTSEQGKPETNSPDRSRRLDRNSRERDRERDLKREKERELERFERDRERERVRRERERELKIREAELLYKERIKDWENREREKDYHRQHEKDREKERQHQRRKEIRDQERDSDDDDDDSRKKRRRIEERRRKRLREKEEDLADRQKEVEEIAEAKRRADEEQQRQLQQQLQDEHEPTPQLQQVINGSEKLPAEESDVDGKATAIEHDDNNNENDSVHCTETGDGVLNGKNEESIVASEGRQIGSAPARKLGFGLVGSGKRTAVPSVFHEEEDDDAHKDKKMRPLVPIDYSTEEIQVVNPTVSVAAPLPPNLVSVAEAVKHGSSANTKEEKHDGERERSKRSHDRSSQRDRERNDEDTSRTREENREKILERDRNRDHGPNKMKTLENKKLLDAKQLIDMIPRTKEELFSYEINWSIYDKHELHERMRPWISKKITEFLGEEEASLVDYIVSSTQSHVKASQMLELLQSILDEEAEMFVLKMWRMLIFEIKKVETGLSMRSKT